MYIFFTYNQNITVYILDEVTTVPVVEGDRLNIKCNYSEAIKISKVHWTKESDDETPFDSSSILSKKLEWYIIFQ